MTASDWVLGMHRDGHGQESINRMQWLMKLADSASNQPIEGFERTL
jgi:hypothetical protein